MKSIAELAELVKGKIDPDKEAKLPADDQHLLKASAGVLSHLGLAHTAVNIGQVAELIRPHMNLEWPRMLYSKAKPAGVHFEEVVFHHKEEKVTVYATQAADDKEAKSLGEGWHQTPHGAAGLEPDHHDEEEEENPDA